MNLIIEHIGGMCPMQAEGTIDGVPFYFRAEGHHWSFSVGENPINIALGWSEGFYRREEWGDSMFAAGYMDETTARQIIEKCATEWVK